MHCVMKLIVRLGLVQTLEIFVPVDPAGVSLLIGKAVLAGKLWSYHFEDQAVELVVRIIRTYIAEPRSIFEKNPEYLRVLRDLLDLLITAGWSSASRAAQIEKVLIATSLESSERSPAARSQPPE